MGSFGRKIGQNDTVHDFCYELEEKEFSRVFKEYGEDFSFKGFLHDEDNNAYNGYNLNCSLFLISLVVEGCKPNSITKGYYCNKGDIVDKVLQISSYFKISDECIKQAREALQGICKYLKVNKSAYIADSMKGTSLYDEFDIENKVPFNNSYEFYSVVISELVEGIKGIKGCNIDIDINDCTEHTVFISGGYGVKKESSSPLNVPSIDRNMLNSGLKDILHLESEEYSRCYYLAEEVNSFPKELYNFLISVFKTVEASIFKQKEIAKDIDVNYILECNTCFEYVAQFVVKECEDDRDYIEFGFSTQKLNRISKEEFWRDDFGDSNIKLKTIKSLVVSVINDWEEKGITVDKITFSSNINFATDIDKLSSYHLYKGVSRVFENIWWVPDNPQPISEDTYEVIYTIVAPESENNRKLGILRSDLAEKMDDYEFYQFEEKDKELFEDEDGYLKVPTELVEKLLNTPISEEISDKYISDIQLYKWDEDRIKGDGSVYF